MRVGSSRFFRGVRFVNENLEKLHKNRRGQIVGNAENASGG